MDSGMGGVEAFETSQISLLSWMSETCPMFKEQKQIQKLSSTLSPYWNAP